MRIEGPFRYEILRRTTILDKEEKKTLVAIQKATIRDLPKVVKPKPETIKTFTDRLKRVLLTAMETKIPTQIYRLDRESYNPKKLFRPKKEWKKRDFLKGIFWFPTIELRY